MIGTINIDVNAQHPNVPLAPVFVWRGSASRINVEGVPRLCGSWYVSSVSIAVATPDGETVSYPCQRMSNGIYATTIEATETPGKSANGLTITATDEAGKDFVLGRGDLYILDGAAIPAPGDVSWTVRLLDKKPEIPKDGDAYFSEDGTLMVYSGRAWRNTMPASVQLVVDSYGVKTAVTIGSRTGSVGPYSLANGDVTTASGDSSHAEGSNTTASGYGSHAEGSNTTASSLFSHAEGAGTTASDYGSHAEGVDTTAYGRGSHAEGEGSTASGSGSHAEGVGSVASGNYSHAEGCKSLTQAGHDYAFAWNGDGGRYDPYASHGKGTFNINPVGGTDGFYVGEKKLSEVISDGVAGKADKTSLAPEYSPSSAYAVGSFVYHDGNVYQCSAAIPEGGEAWNAAHWEMRKLDDFFTESNSLLNGRLAYSRNATGLKDRAFNMLSFDGTEFNLSTALAAVTPTASGQPRDLLIVAIATAATTISFTAGTIKGDKPTIDGSGTWLITLTEYSSGVWYCRQIKMEDAA